MILACDHDEAPETSVTEDSFTLENVSGLFRYLYYDKHCVSARDN